MKTVRLRRLTPLSDKTCRFGQMEKENGQVICEATLEEPYRDENNDGLTDKGTSCIPAGTYDMFLRRSKFATGFKPCSICGVTPGVLHKSGCGNAGTGNRKYDVWELRGVPGRDHVQVHIGNTLDHTEGCILVGRKRAESTPATILGSTDAHTRWMAHLEGDVVARIEVVEFEPPVA